MQGPRVAVIGLDCAPAKLVFDDMASETRRAVATMIRPER